MFADFCVYVVGTLIFDFTMQGETAVQRLQHQGLYENVKGGRVCKFYVFVFRVGYHFK